MIWNLKKFQIKTKTINRKQKINTNIKDYNDIGKYYYNEDYIKDKEKRNEFERIEQIKMNKRKREREIEESKLKEIKDNDEEKNRIINSKRIIENKKKPKTIDILRGKTNKAIKENKENESEENKDILFNNRYNNKNNRNYLLDSDEEDYENNLLEKSYNILRARNKNNLNQMNNIFNDTIDNTYINTLDTINYENNLSISINESNNPKLLKPRIKPVIKRKKKIL